jgi:hypothetical protein
LERHPQTFLLRKRSATYVRIETDARGRAAGELIGIANGPDAVLTAINKLHSELGNEERRWRYQQQIKWLKAHPRFRASTEVITGASNMQGSVLQQHQ